MDHGSPNLAEKLRQCQRRIHELEQIVAQQQDVIAGYQEQLAQASEQLCLLKRALFGRRRERYAPSPDQLLLFTPEPVEGLSDEKATPVEEA
jgi:ABC-type transporter Mla subunit MlaD